MIVRVGEGLPVEVLVMPVFRRIPVWLVLASYVFANTLASSWHDHRDCCDHSDTAHQHSADCATIDQHDHGHAHCQNHDRCQIHERCGNHDRGQNHEQGQADDGDEQHAPQHCVVCDFLALAPLPALPVVLVSAGEIVPEFVTLHILPITCSAIETHLARGPPVQS